jgi:glutamate N-acetyltransferase / amino-acid N-acetyltransferase
MVSGAEFIRGGSVTSPAGFRAGAIACGISRIPGKLDLGLLVVDSTCAVAGVFTQSSLAAAPVKLDRERIKSGHARAIIVNSGCANASTGETGDADALEMARLGAAKLGISEGEVLVSSTGVIGETLPMDNLRGGVTALELKADGGPELARAMMTTDTVPKTAAVTCGGITIGGAAKGSGMIHPDMATLLAFVTTDAALSPAHLAKALKQAADVSFNMVSIDGDTSTNDTLLLLANGAAGEPLIEENSAAAADFQAALEALCIYLAKQIARDGEGAQRLFAVTVSGAASRDDAALAARTIVSSPLVKTAVAGADPNWGRLVMALGRSGAAVDAARLEIKIGEHPVMRAGQALAFDVAAAAEYLRGEALEFRLDLKLGSGSATAWGCDLTAEYVRINADYTT